MVIRSAAQISLVECEKQKEVIMRMRRLTLLAITVAVSVLVLGSIAHAADNQAGTWKLNVAKSKYSPGPATKGRNSHRRINTQWPQDHDPRHRR